MDEQIAYCPCLSVCPKLQTMEEEEAFKKDWIAVDGFASNTERRHHIKMHNVRVHCNLLALAKQIIDNRNNSHASMSSHVGNIILKSLKLIQSCED
ncbi:unnamed protein product [Rotaria sp. Silwood2]|nr:unnamed protein product [Rotaria sp. Silwood2]CAF2993334.1 unnamed protein product [Rotaria sp. Silwood2]CAF3145526.1 unnamed protein product [Rotaria sp. Silwood2]CAF3904339.1 unnamed protein product [Rotaria sp. Silwood2]CAF3971546.1 unnamed protein product [Rotaria sp. Silwood2]